MNRAKETLREFIGLLTLVFLYQLGDANEEKCGRAVYTAAGSTAHTLR
jgi:hypothetical protein